jgi:hypothetical protein
MNEEAMTRVGSQRDEKKTKQDRQCIYNVALVGIRAAIVAVEKQ